MIRRTCDQCGEPAECIEIKTVEIPDTKNTQGLILNLDRIDLCTLCCNRFVGQIAHLLDQFKKDQNQT